MWHFEHLPTDEKQAEVAPFLAALNAQVDFFTPHSPLWLGRAPGRLDLMGGIADYSGALVLELPLAVATWVAVQSTHEPTITLLSTGEANPAGDLQMTLDLTIFQSGLDYSNAHTLLTADAQQAWGAYVVGVLIALQQEHLLKLEQGLRIFIYSNVPSGKGVSSSAALEVATMQALCGLYNLDIAGRRIALLCQQVENLVVGAPCGVMDQMTSACGERNSLLALLCQPAELQGSIDLPAELEVWGIDSGIRHAVTGADYGSVRVGAFMGYRIIADLAGLPVQPRDDEQMDVSDVLWNGYLANIPPSLWETTYRDQLPQQIDGATFLARYSGSTDRVTRINPHTTYAVRQPTAHPIYEHHRVQLFRSLLMQAVNDEIQFRLLGELMYQSHNSYSTCGLGSHGTDHIVALVREAGPATGLYGAKITGGGSGGTVAVLAHRGSKQAIERIAHRYSQETSLPLEILGGSSAGAVAWGRHRLIA